ncbi:Leucine-rich repeat-containing protein 45 [Blastocladiella emersonii ATCC 22665]|nr:Leucine-rich repeat-containing protein 45 [Blastocladiella emersonii ATCC 22665]
MDIKDINDELRTSFLRECRRLNIHPSSLVLDQLGVRGDPGRAASPSSPSRSASPRKSSLADPTEHADALFGPVLRLAGQAIDRKTMKALAAVLEKDSRFRSIVLADAFLGDDGTIAVTKALRENPYVARLDLRGNSIQLEGGLAVAAFLKATRSLEELVLEWNALGLWDEVMGALGDALAINTSLRTLDLRNNKIGPAGTELLAQGLRTNRTLLTLDMRWNNSGWLGGTALATLFQFNSTLTALDAVGNDIPDPTLRTIHVALDRNARATRQARDAVRMHDALQGAHAAHAEALARVQHDLADREKDVARLARALAAAENETDQARDATRAAEARTATVAKERDALASTLREAQDAAETTRTAHLASERALRASLAEAHRRTAESEAKLAATAADRDAALESVAAANKEIDRRRDRERRLAADHAEALEAESRAAADRVAAVERARDTELARAAAAAQRRIDELEATVADRDRELRETRAAADERRKALEAQLADAATRARATESARVRALEEEVALATAARDTATRETERVRAALLSSVREAETAAARAAQDKAAAAEGFGVTAAQLAHVQAETAELRARIKEAGERAATAVADAEQLFRDKERLKGDKRELTREVERLREEVKRFEADEERRRRGERERLKQLESAFGNYLHGALAHSDGKPGV